ncbi:hypothetical protein BU24DRAFT_493521 [Aaosphaeria arxii CBS 175.79]|uniref:DSC E3 ubiquitin ligase complex subunit A n=1 Tax=Aaosphaeria arxii CBS 175.79 TaxID=1450172 RepID=A0A6A5XS02_9PLEO|nr:uncharacterized protein BU24DRAFT_493521 [Aaosphaeria arxii CBS 175.79]KAF2015044.1 hypothetical protein BU24DRAFT_493521 [Aaosphaeria arxii CBS 175.79]
MSSNQGADGPSTPGGSSSKQDAATPDPFVPRATRPGYMTVGSGSTPEAAARLVSMLDQDSGYGGSVANGEGSGPMWHPNIVEDRPTPPHTPHEGNAADHDRQRSQVLQLRYNKNKNALARAIQGTVDTLKGFQEMNLSWPAHYPSAQQDPQSPQHSRTESRPGLQHTQSALGRPEAQRSPDRPKPPRRAETTIEDAFGGGESSSAAEQEKKPEPRLITPQLAHDFSVLKLELRMGGRTQTDLVHSLEKSSVASLLDGQIQQSIRHLYSIRERIEDTSSKVLVTGDLNAGKSTFCNALLRRKLLPEDQQPCTSIFCEVLDYRENGMIEEVHAVPINNIYNRHDESTYVVFDLKDLEKIVIDNERFSQCKIYIRDIRSETESLLNNGVVDIALIDAPGLNMDSVKTTAVFARQEEIDVVVFVVSAANHFTESAKNFIFTAAREKAYMFMVVNGFDTIRDQERCQNMILKQVHNLSPATFKESSELVHFVSSNAIPMAPGGGDDDGDDDPSDKGKGKEADKIRDFEELETSLRRFVLEKRARSKLAPAKTYLLNVLGDIHNLATVNRDVAQSELDRVKKEMDEVEPEFEQSKKARTEAGETVDRMVEETTSDVYNYTRDTINSSIAKVADQDLGIAYPGLLSAYQYAEDIRDSMLHEITETVRQCEDHARAQTVEGYNGVKNIGILHLGDTQYANVMFLPERMFRKSMHALARQVDIDIDVWDFFDVSGLWERQEKAAGTGMALTVAGMVGGRVIGGVGWLDGALGAAKILGSNNMRRLLVPGLIAGFAIGVSYVLSSIPKSLPHRLSAKLSSQLAAIDYTHSNALRISSEVRRALKSPASDVRIGLQRNVEKLQLRKEETAKSKAAAEVARKYFGNLVRSSNDIRQGVQRIDLDAPPPNFPTLMQSFVFFIILLLIINSPGPEQQPFNTRNRYDDVLEREWSQLDLLNRTRYGDFDAKKNKWLNISGLRDEDGFDWESLGAVKRRAIEQTKGLLGQDADFALDGSDDPGGGNNILVYRNVSGYVEGEWVRSSIGRVRHPSDMNLTATIADGPFPSSEFERNLTGNSGSIRVHVTELDGRSRTDENKTISELAARVVIGDDGSFGGNWFEFLLNGVHFTKTGGAVLTTTSDRFGGIFALPHFQLSQHLYSSSQELLNSTIHDTIERQINRVYPLWNPWTSAPEGANEALFTSPHCEFVLYLQQHPIASLPAMAKPDQSQTNQGFDIDWYENELRFPTGAPVSRNSPLAMSLIGFSPDCGFVIESKGPPDFPPGEFAHLVGTKTEGFNDRARRGIVAFAATLTLQLVLLIKQMKETATPSTRNRVSFYTIAMLGLGDGFGFLSLIFMHLFLGTAQLALYATAFMSLFSVVFELRFLMDIWTVQVTEQIRQDRQQASTTTPPNAPTPPPTAVDTPVPSTNLAPGGGLPLPATAPRRGASPPIIIAPDQDDPLDDATTPTPAGANTTNNNPGRAELGALYSRYCLSLIAIFFMTLQFTTMRTTARAFYFNTLCFLYLSFWCPQIYRNIMRNCRKALRWDFVLGQSAVRMIPIYYFYAVPDNVLFSSTDVRALLMLAAWVWLQILALASQEILGSRFFVREGWAPPAYDYHPILREDEEGATMPIGSDQTPSSPSTTTSSSKPGESKAGKGKKVFDCSICAQDIEVPVIPAGGASADDSTAGLTSGGLVLQRRAYMVTPCRHIFHTPCLEGWMRYRLQCPNCRETLPPL